jgi:hypothetical protein
MALSQCGHKVEVCPWAIVSNFSMQLCLKEEDGSFTHIPTAMFLSTVVERSSDGRAAYFPMPHGGMDIQISGPIVGRGARPANLRFYVSKEGLCCFHPDKDQDTPWQVKMSLYKCLSVQQCCLCCQDVRNHGGHVQPHCHRVRVAIRGIWDPRHVQ